MAKPSKQISISTTNDNYNFNYGLNLSDNNSLVCKYLQSNKDKLIDTLCTKYVDNIILSNGYMDITELFNYNSKTSFNVIYNLFNDLEVFPSNIFENCPTLYSVTQIPDKFEKINSRTFAGCSNLRFVNIPSSITEIGEYAFAGCKMLKSLNVEGVRTIYDKSFAGSGITSITLNPSISVLPPYLFADCKNLEEFVTDKNMQIGEGVFSGCSSLKKVELGAFIGSSSSIIDTGDGIEENESNEGGNESGDNPGEIENPKDYNLYTNDGNKIDYEITKDQALIMKNGGIANLIETDNEVKVQLINDLTITIYYKGDDAIYTTTTDYSKISVTDENNESAPLYTKFEFTDFIHYETGKVTLIPYVVYDATKSVIVYYIYDEEGENNFLTQRQATTDKLIAYQTDTNNFVYSYYDPYYLVVEGNKIPLYNSNYKELGVVQNGVVIKYINDELAQEYNTQWHKVTVQGAPCDYYIDKAESVSPVQSYGNSLFVNRSMIFGGSGQVSEVTGPTVLPNYIFAGCTNLDFNNVSFMEDIKTIGIGSLMNCIKLESLENELTEIKKYAFKDCIYLKNVNTSNCTLIDNYAFKNCKSLETIDLGSIDDTDKISVFEGCINLESVENTNNITKYGNKYFKDCINLMDIDLSNITEIGDKTFMNCEKLGIKKNPDYFTIQTETNYDSNGIIINTSQEETDNENSLIVNYQPVNGQIQLYSITNTENGSNNNSNNSTMYIENRVDISNVTSFGDYAFANCSSLKNIELNNSATFGKGVFMNCSNLVSIELPESVSNFTEKMFEGCSSLTSIKFNAPIEEEIDLSGINKCNKINSIELEESTKYKSVNNQCIVDLDTNTIIYVVKDINVFEITNEDFGTDINIDEHAFDNSNVSIINISENIHAPEITNNTFANISNNNFHILISKQDPRYREYINILGKNKIYYI